MAGLKELVRPPFANYDVVVYFGGGLFLIPFLTRYVIEPTGLSWPTFKIRFQDPLPTDIVSVLAILFGIYIIGHLLAYLGSQLIEKLFDRVLGKISTAILVSSWSSSRNRNEYIRALIFDRIRKIKRDRALFPTFVRVVAHLPILPVYILIYVLGIFGYYDTRVPYSVIRAANRRIKTIGLGAISISIRTKWYKVLEYYVINRSAPATSRMYNYLVIGGLFRSVSMVLLIANWFQLYHILHYKIDGDWFVAPFMGSMRPYIGLAEFCLTQLAFIFSVFSYLKFQRRYAEEAIFAFALADLDQVDVRWSEG